MKRSIFIAYSSAFLISFAVLQLEIAMTRIYSILTWHHFTPMIISIALLGFGSAGSILTLSQKKGNSTHFQPKGIAKNAFLFSFFTIFSLLLIVRIYFEPLDLTKDPNNILSLIYHYVFMAIPFYFAGLALGSLIVLYKDRIGHIYFADLLGASIGSLTSTLFLHLLGATNMVAMCAFLVGIAALLLDGVDGKKASASSWFKLSFLFIILLLGFKFNPFLVYPPPSKGLYQLVSPDKGTKNLESSQWDVVARTDITTPMLRGVPAFSGNVDNREGLKTEYRLIFQDGAAATGIFKLESPTIDKMIFFGKYLQAAPYALKKEPRVLIIGLGGGVDGLIAHYHGARLINGVEINPLTVKAITKDYIDYTKNIFNNEPFHIINEEGRHFLSHDKTHYDVIQLSGVDTFTALASGAYALAENYLYTIEAIESYWDHLTPNGITSFSRWYFDPPRESLKLAAMMVEAMERKGIREPWKHIVVVKSVKYPYWADTMMCRRPYIPEEIRDLRQWANDRTFALMYDPLRDKGSIYDKVLRADAKTRKQFYKNYTYNITPDTDDKPFFFNFYKWSSLFSKKISKYGYTTTNFPLGLRTLVISLLQVILLAFLGIFYPLNKLKQSVFNKKGKWPVIIYFSALGLGFIFVEIVIIQKLMFFLGGPTHAFSITLFSILLFSGLGSFFSERQKLFSNRKHFLLLALLIIGFIIIIGVILTQLLPLFLEFGMFLRILVSVILIAFPSFFMGMAFPSGIRLLNRYDPDWVPWAWAINSFASVCGSIGCIFISMQVGFFAALLFAAIIYGIGFYSISRLNPVNSISPIQ